MALPARRVALILVALAVVLSAGRWLSVFLTERLWESSVSEPVAVAGLRHALLGISLNILVLLLSAAWFVAHLTAAARAALPDKAPPERPDARVWPARVPRWSLLVLALALSVVVGGGADRWLYDLLLSLEGVRVGVADPLLGVDLGFFVSGLRLWLELQQLALTLCLAALVSVLIIHLAGGAIGVSQGRLWISPGVRGHLAILLTALALSLAWGASLEEYRLAAGHRGAVVRSEFLLRTLVAQVQTGLGAAAVVASILWWGRRWVVAAAIVWLLFAAVLIAGPLLPLGNAAAGTDEDWRIGAHRLDSIAYALGEPRGKAIGLKSVAGEATPTLWDERMIPAAAFAESASVTVASRGWVVAGQSLHPVWFALRERNGAGPALLALADDQVTTTGSILAWREGDSTPSAGAPAFRDFPAHGMRPTAPALDVGVSARGVSLDSWPKRLILAWALQEPAAFRAPKGSRIGWRLDPAARLHAAAPFAQWSRPRIRILRNGVVWTSDGLLSSEDFPSSTRITWNGATVSMVRPAFLGTVNAETGEVHLYRRDPADSLASAWSRVVAPLIEPPEAVPSDLRYGDPYPEELALAQARVLSGPGWNAGNLERTPQGAAIAVPPWAGGGDVLVPFVRKGSRELSAFMLARRMVSGDSVRLFQLDSTSAVESGVALNLRWEKFPFQQGIRDSIRAAEGRLELGEVRQEVARDGIAAYQPAWAVSKAGKAQLVLVNVALGRGNLGTGRSYSDAWRNLRGSDAPVASGSSAEAVLDQARKWLQHADSALKRGDMQEFGRALEYLRGLLEPRKTP